MLALDSEAVFQAFCLVTLVLIMFDVDEENISQNGCLCHFCPPHIPPLAFFFCYFFTTFLISYRGFFFFNKI